MQTRSRVVMALPKDIVEKYVEAYRHPPKWGEGPTDQEIEDIFAAAEIIASVDVSDITARWHAEYRGYMLYDVPKPKVSSEKLAWYLKSWRRGTARTIINRLRQLGLRASADAHQHDADWFDATIVLDVGVMLKTLRVLSEVK